MYPEFVAIYVGLGILALLLITVIILLSVVLVKVSKGSTKKYMNYSAPNSNQSNTDNAMGIVFCLNCGTGFDGATRVCPKCGRPR